MQDLIDLFRHNAWANDLVFRAAQAHEGALAQDVLDTLDHLARVEDVYLAMIDGMPRPERAADDTLDALHSRVREFGPGFVRSLESVAPERLEQDLNVPWFDFRISVREGYLQVLSHSSQHRAQVLMWLSERGVKTPDLDYVLMLREQRRA